jgi:hypothetical protein
MAKFAITHVAGSTISMGEPTGAKIEIDPAFVAGVEELPGKPRASKVVFMDRTQRICVGFPEEVRARLGKR